MKKLVVVVLVIAALAFPCMAADKIVMKCGHESEGDIRMPGTGSTAGLAVFKNHIESATGGEIEVKLYPDNSLGNNRSMVEQTQQGITQLNRSYTSVMVSFCPELALTQIPFLFRNNLIAWKVLDGPFGKELADVFLKKTGLRILSWGEGNGFRNIYAKFQVKTPADLKGVKVRVPENPGLLALFKALGAQTVTITWKEIYTSLQAGMAVATDTELNSMYYKKLYEVVPYVTMTRHAYNMHFLMINDDFYQKLSPEHKRVIWEAAALYEDVTNGYCRAAELKTAEEMVNAGCTFYYPTPAEIKQYKDLAVEPYLDIIRKKVDQQWIDKVFKAVGDAEKEIDAMVQ